MRISSIPLKRAAKTSVRWNPKVLRSLGARSASHMAESDAPIARMSENTCAESPSSARLFE